jgi:oligoendopeptidase F
MQHLQKKHGRRKMTQLVNDSSVLQPKDSGLSRNFLPADLKVNRWEDLKPFYEALRSRPVNNASDLRKWLLDRSELDSVVQEDLAWRYIRMSCDTTNTAFAEAFNYFVTEIEPRIAPYSNHLNKQLLASPFLSQLNDDRMEIMVRGIRKQVEIFREENIPLYAELQQKEQKFAAISGAMTVEVDGNELTLQQASNFLKNTDRNKRREVFEKIQKRRLADREPLDALFNELIVLRHRIALNAGFSDFRDYMFAALGRFDYTAADCFQFHDSIAAEVVPLAGKILAKRKALLGLDTLRPWDLEVDISGKNAPVPSLNGNDLMEKTIRCFTTIHPFLGNCMELLKGLNRVDLDSRKGKAPGGFNYPLHETGVPFIFMNSSNSVRDMVTIVHEGGHAVHSILTKDLDYTDFRNTPSEVAELASMSMELISMEHWEAFFDDADALRRARRQHIEKLIESLPWIAAIDKFQHWIYTHPDHTVSERRAEWTAINKQFSGGVVDWSGYEDAFENSWQKQLHLYQVPFYYIEYGMAQLGALAIWRNYKNDPAATLQSYLEALKLGYTTTIGRIYQTAGIRFDFSRDWIHELSAFAENELNKLD